MGWIDTTAEVSTGVLHLNMQWQVHLNPVAKTAQKILLALGYQIVDMAGMLSPCSCCDGANSRHNIVGAYAHIETALQARRQPSK